MRARPHKYTEEQRSFIRENIKGTSRKEMTVLFNKRFGTDLKVSQITSFIKRNKLKNGRETKFENGQKAWNKGMKGLNCGGEKGWFKKGNIPHNYMPVGSERVNTIGYVDVKIADPNVWKAKHRIIWEEAIGPVPEGHVLIFGDGNRLNVSLNNLILVSRQQLNNLNRHGLIRNDIELTKTGIIIADLHQKISDRKK